MKYKYILYASVLIFLFNSCEKEKNEQEINEGDSIFVKEVHNPASDQLFNQVSDILANLPSSDLTNEPIIEVPIKFHDILMSNGSGNTLNEAYISILLQRLNNNFTDAKIEFIQCGDINVIFSNDLYNFPQVDYSGTTGYDFSDLENIMDMYNFENVLNIYLPESIGGGVGGFYPGQESAPHLESMLVIRKNLINQALVFEHEIGHWLYLPHTHGSCNLNCTTDELVDGSNCQTAGDRICDTPADPNLYNKVNSNCQYTEVKYDENNDQFVPDTRNIMSYTTGNCREYFSDGQLLKMGLGLRAVRPYISSVSCGSSTSTLEANFSVSNTSVTTNQQIIFNDQSLGNPISWEWTFSGGTPSSSSSQNPTVTYSSAGTYSVSLKVTNSLGNEDTEFKNAYITVSSGGNAPIANFSANQTALTVGQQITFTDLSSNSPTSWSWTFQGGTPQNSNTQNPTVTYNTPGTYDVTLQVSNAFGTDTEVKQGYIVVSNGGSTGCAGTFIDSRDGQEYCYVTIGSQIWMAENLNYDDGSGSWCYDNTNYYCNQYGRLYSWSNFMNGSSATNQFPSGVQGICPNGWHVPSRYEIQELLDNYSSNSDAFNALIDGGSSGFNAKRGGFANLASSTLLNYFYGINSGAGFWSASESSTGGVFHYFLSFSGVSSSASLSTSGEEGMYCRCVKD